MYHLNKMIFLKKLTQVYPLYMLQISVHVHIFIQHYQDLLLLKQGMCVQTTLQQSSRVWHIHFKTLDTIDHTCAYIVYHTDMRPPGPHFMEHHKKVTKEQFLRVQSILHCTNLIKIIIDQLLQGICTPFPTIIKLNPSICDAPLSKEDVKMLNLPTSRV